MEHSVQQFLKMKFQESLQLNAINNFDGIEYWDDPLPTPLDAEGRDNVLVSRMREGLSSKKILNFWVVSDNLLKGAALNAVQIAKYVSEL